MFKKKLEIVELNKKKDTIVFKEKQSPLASFYKKYGSSIFRIFLVLSLLILILGLWIGITNFFQSEEMIIKKVSIDTTLSNENSYINGGHTPLTEETAKAAFNQKDEFRGQGAILLTNTIEASSYVIKFYSDGTAIKILKQGNLITRISALENGEYGISKDGVINTKAVISDITIKEIKEFPWGTITYFKDGSAEVTDAKINLFVRNQNEIFDNFITNNKISYLKETKNIGKSIVNYYYDGTIEVKQDNKSYLVRNKNDINITNNDVTFKQNNKAEIRKTITLADGKIIDYYTDGGAIIKDGSRTLSVRKSNSIIIKNNKIFEITDNIYVEQSKVANNGNIIYYTNGSAVVKRNGQVEYVEENSYIKYYDNNQISHIEKNTQKLNKETNIKDQNVKVFETIAVVTTKDYVAIVPKDSIIYNKDGTIQELLVKDLIDSDNSFTITNNTNEQIKYRVVIEKSNRTNLDVEYIRYQLSVKETYIEPKKLNTNIWKTDDISNALNIKGTNYILIDSTLEAHDSADIKLMLWTDYDTIPNSMQNKYFYGTIKVYAWTETKK